MAIAVIICSNVGVLPLKEKMVMVTGIRLRLAVILTTLARPVKGPMTRHTIMPTVMITGSTKCPYNMNEQNLLWDR